MLGCAAFTRLSSSGTSDIKPIQLSLLAVRKTCRKMGIGRHLMQVQQCVCTCEVLKFNFFVVLQGP